MRAGRGELTHVRLVLASWSPSAPLMMVAMLKSVRCACPVRKEDSATVWGSCPAGGAPPASPAEALATMATACPRSSRRMLSGSHLCGRSRSREVEARVLAGHGFPTWTSGACSPSAWATVRAPSTGREGAGAQNTEAEPLPDRRRGPQSLEVCPRQAWPPTPWHRPGSIRRPEPRPDGVPRKSCRNHGRYALYHVEFCVCPADELYLPRQPSDTKTNLNVPGHGRWA